jgi:hypothetical protein
MQQNGAIGAIVTVPSQVLDFKQQSIDLFYFFEVCEIDR